MIKRDINLGKYTLKSIYSFFKKNEKDINNELFSSFLLWEKIEI